MLIITCIDLSCQYILYIMMVTPVLGRTHDRQLGRMSTTWKPVRLGAGPPLSGRQAQPTCVPLLYAPGLLPAGTWPLQPANLHDTSVPQATGVLPLGLQASLHVASRVCVSSMVPPQPPCSQL